MRERNDLAAPVVEEFGGPGRRIVVPELLEIFLGDSPKSSLWATRYIALQCLIEKNTDSFGTKSR
jgi:hypothetical protein